MINQSKIAKQTLIRMKKTPALFTGDRDAPYRRQGSDIAFGLRFLISAQKKGKKEKGSGVYLYVSEKCCKKGKKMEFRPARPEDLNEICGLVASAIVHMQEQKIFQWDESYPTREDFMNDLQENTLFVGLIDGEIAVTFTVNQTCEPEYNDGNWQYPDEEYRIVHRFCVNPKFQGRGVAGQALRHIEKELRRQKVGAVRLDTFTGNPPAVALYTKNGYVKRGFADWRMGRFYLMEKSLW